MTIKDISETNITLQESSDLSGCFIEIGLPVNLWCGENPEYFSKEEGLELAILIKSAVSLALKINPDDPVKGLMELEKNIPDINNGSQTITEVVVENSALRKEISYMRYGFILSTAISILCILGSVATLIFRP